MSSWLDPFVTALFASRHHHKLNGYKHAQTCHAFLDVILRVKPRIYLSTPIHCLPSRPINLPVATAGNHQGLPVTAKRRKPIQDVSTIYGSIPQNWWNPIQESIPSPMPHIAKPQCTRFYSIQVYQLYIAVYDARCLLWPGPRCLGEPCIGPDAVGSCGQASMVYFSSKFSDVGKFLSTFLMAGSWPRSSQSSFFACRLCHERKLQVRHQFMNWSSSWTFTKVLFLMPLNTLLNIILYYAFVHHAISSVILKSKAQLSFPASASHQEWRQCRREPCCTIRSSEALWNPGPMLGHARK